MAPSKKSKRIDKQVIAKIARERQLEIGTVEQVLWLSRVLSALSHSEQCDDFALMGGSAIVFLHRDLYRLSTDLDLDFIGNPNLGKNGSHEVEERIKSDRKLFRDIAKRCGMNLRVVTKSTIARAAKQRFVQYELDYVSNFSRAPRSVEVDMAYRYCHTVLDPETKPWPIPVPELVEPFQVRSLSAEELYAGKIIALVAGKQMTRLDFPTGNGLLFKRKIRHLYDTYVLANEVMRGDDHGFDLAMLRRLVLLFGVTRIKDFAMVRGESLVVYRDAERSEGLVPVVARGKEPPTVKVMRRVVRRFLDTHIFDYGDNEYEFTEDFEAGHFRPQKIFSAREADRLKRMFYHDQLLRLVTPLKGG